jgi:hypothetical protein
VDVEVVHHGVDPRDIGFDPALDRAEEIDVEGGPNSGHSAATECKSSSTDDRKANEL